VKVLEPATLKWEHPSLSVVSDVEAKAPRGPSPKGVGPKPPSTPPPPRPSDEHSAAVAMAPLSTQKGLMNQYMRFKRMRRAARREV